MDIDSGIETTDREMDDGSSAAALTGLRSHLRASSKEYPPTSSKQVEKRFHFTAPVFS